MCPAPWWSDGGGVDGRRTERWQARKNYRRRTAQQAAQNGGGESQSVKPPRKRVLSNGFSTANMYIKCRQTASHTRPGQRHGSAPQELLYVSLLLEPLPKCRPGGEYNTSLLGGAISSNNIRRGRPRTPPRRPCTVSVVAASIGCQNNSICSGRPHTLSHV
jgi:hypothetical protein